MDDNWHEEEARSQIWNEKAQKIFNLYIDNAIACINNTKIKRLHQDEDGERVEYEQPNETFMRAIEEAIDISVNQAKDFRAIIVAKWNKRRGGYSYNRMRWHEDGAMYQAIGEVLRMLDWANNPTIKIINALEQPRYKKFNEIQPPDKSRAYEEVHIKYTCTCSIDTLMSTGCKCGHLEKYENTRQ